MLTSIAGNPNVTDQSPKGLTLDGRNYKVHLDGYDQTALITERALRTATKFGILPRPISAQ